MWMKCFWLKHNRYIDPQPAMYPRCSHWFPEALAPSVGVRGFGGEVGIECGLLISDTSTQGILDSEGLVMTLSPAGTRSTAPLSAPGQRDNGSFTTCEAGAASTAD